jgi:glycosyltransferase involved in cell wall biosynthesis
VAQVENFQPLPKRRLVEDAWIVIAAYNEETRLGETLQTLCGKYAHVVVVDDSSSDRTWEVAARFPVWRLRHMINCGQGAAMQTGIEFALARGAEMVVTFDADGQHRAEEIEQMLEPIRRQETDVTLGSRFLGDAINIPKSRWLVLKLGVLFTRLVSHIRVTDAHNGLRAFSRDAALRIRIHQNRMAHASEILDEIRRGGLRYREVPVTIRYSDDSLAKGQSSWNAFRVTGQFLLGRLIR